MGRMGEPDEIVKTALFLASAWIAADTVRIQDGILVEHWDVIQDEATEEQSISKQPTFGTTLPTGA